MKKLTSLWNEAKKKTKGIAAKLSFKKRRPALSRRDWQIAGGLAVVAALIGIIIASLPKADKQAAAAVNEIFALADGIRSTYRAKPNYWGLDTASALAEGIVPPALVKKGGIVNSLGQDMLIGSGAAAETVMPGSRGFDIVLPRTGKKACMLLMSAKLNERQQLGLAGVTLKNSAETLYSWGGENRFPLEILQTRKACENSNIIIWHFE